MWRHLLCAGCLSATAMAEANVEGLYGTDCFLVSGLSAVKDLVLAEDASFEMVQTLFADEHCERPVYDLAFRGTYSFETHTSMLDITLNEFYMRALDDRVVAVFNDQAICGWTNWGLDISMNVDSRECGEQKIPANGTVVHESVRMTTDGLYFGPMHSELPPESLQAGPSGWGPAYFRLR